MHVRKIKAAQALAMASALAVAALPGALAQSTSSPGSTTSSGTAAGSAPSGSAMTPGTTSSSTRDDRSGRRSGSSILDGGTREGSVYGANPIPDSSVTRDSTVGSRGSLLPTPGAGDRITVPDTSLGETRNVPDVSPAAPDPDAEQRTGGVP